MNIYIDWLTWLTALARWGHVVAAIAWIGASFYLITWENKFLLNTNRKSGIAGDFWTIQGGDFYHVQKIDGTPTPLPTQLNWFKYEAYFTWLTGFLLLTLIYYVNASKYLINDDSWIQDSGAAILISILSLALVWIVYYGYSVCRYARNTVHSTVVGILSAVILSLFYTNVFTDKAAFIHLGAAMATIMSGNVFFVIIPWHNRLLRAIKANQSTEILYANHPGFRSRHNHYLTLPVVFLMLSAHLPVVFQADHQWLVGLLIILIAALLKHSHTCHQRRQPTRWFLLLSFILLFILAALTGFQVSRNTTKNSACIAEVDYLTVQAIVSDRCLACHSTQGGQASTGTIKLTTVGDLIRNAPTITHRAVNNQDMPPGNVTNMQLGERQALNCWLLQNQ